MKDIVGCSWYSEGCKGGEGFHVAKFGRDFRYLPEKLNPFTSKQNLNCNHRRPKSALGLGYHTCNIRCRTTFYEYLGGYYGSPDNTEELMMREIRARGPLMASILVPMEFALYKSGVVDCDQHMPKTSLRETEAEVLKRLRENFMPVEHLIMIIGWGVTEQGEKYWICQNSYQPAR